MTQDLLLSETLNEALLSINAGGDGVRDGVATLLMGILDYQEQERTNGVNCTEALNAALRRLVEDPYLTLGVDPDSDEVSIKKSYRKYALRYHPDKNKATAKLFQAVQGAHVSSSIVVQACPGRVVNCCSNSLARCMADFSITSAA